MYYSYINNSDLARRYGLNDVKLGNMVARMWSSSNSITEVHQKQGVGSTKCLEGSYLLLTPKK